MPRVLRRISACRRSAAASAAGTIVGVVRLPPEIGPRGRAESPSRPRPPRAHPEGAGDRRGDDAAAAGPHVLHRHAGDQAAAANGELHLGVRLPQIEPVGRGGAYAAAEAALLAAGRLPPRQIGSSAAQR